MKSGTICTSALVPMRDAPWAEEPASALGGKKLGKQWSACCLAHDDNSPNLIKLEGRTGAVQVRCMAGCEPIATLTPRPLDRAGRRRLARAMRKDARRGIGSAEDSAFFKADPPRNHRMRLATANEIAVFDSAEGTQAGADGCWWLVVVRQLAPGERAMTRIYAPLPPWPLTETSERLAQVVFEINVGWQS